MIAPLPPLLLRGDCLVELARIPDGSVDSIVTDPPYGLEFMGKAWDNFGAGFNGGGTSATKNAPSYSSEPNATCSKCGGRMRGAKSCACPDPDFRVKGEPTRRGGSNHAAMLAFEEWTSRWAAECLRILKPGGHMLAFGGSRTWHRLAAGIEDAGFEIRDSIAWIYGSGFPKSMDVSKAIEAKILTGGSGPSNLRRVAMGDEYAPHPSAGTPGYGSDGIFTGAVGKARSIEERDPAKAKPLTTDAAREWEGWGTALKPAFEPIVVGRKPLGEKTVAANVLAHRTGALNIDATRIGTDERTSTIRETGFGANFMDDGWQPSGREYDKTVAGRWPANVALDESQAAALDAQTGVTKSASKGSERTLDAGRSDFYRQAPREGVRTAHGDEGGASRFFYVAKAPKSERPVVDGTAHPTVKPLALMRWLIRLVTPPGGCVVDPFAGSGTTLEAAYLEGFESIGVEMTPEYWPLIEARIARVTA